MAGARTRCLLLGLMGGLCCAVSSSAQEAPASGAGASEQDLAKATQDPVADLISVPFQDNLGIGPFDRPRNTRDVQPVGPVPLSERWLLVTRVILPLLWPPGVASDRWVIPFGAGVGKVTKPGKQPRNASVSAYWNAVRPDEAASWQLRAQLAFLFPEGKSKAPSPPR